MKRKSVAAVVTAAAMMMSLAACGSSAADSTPAASESTASSEAASGEAAPAESEAAADFDTDQDITVISREDGSGTRGAFTELCGIMEDDKDNTVSSHFPEGAAPWFPFVFFCKWHPAILLPDHTRS